MNDDHARATAKFFQPIRAIGGPAFETLADARAYVHALPAEKHASQYWGRVKELLDTELDAAALLEVEQQIRLALFNDGFTVTW
jgi:hypothetical protein